MSEEDSKKDWDNSLPASYGIIVYLQMISFVQRVSGWICTPIVACMIQVVLPQAMYIFVLFMVSYVNALAVGT